MDRKDKAQVKDISQKIKKGIRDNQRVQNIFEELKGIISIANIKTRKENLITHMRNEVGDIEASRKGIANTFAKFHEDLYSRRNGERKDEKDNDGRRENNCDHADDDESFEDDEQYNHTTKFTMKELIIAIDSLIKGRSADSEGIKAEDLKGVGEETTKMTHDVFNLIIKQDSMTPSSWKRL